MRILTINSNDAGQRVDKFITKALPTLPSTLLYKFIRTKKIKVNRKRCEISQRLSEGDEIQLFIPEEFFLVNEDLPFLSLTPKLDIAYEDENVIIVNKKAGVVVHEDESESVDTLINHILSYLYRKGEYDPSEENSFTPALCNRIDRNTCGLVIAAKNAAALRDMNEIIKERRLKKKYLCIVHGILNKKSDTLVAYHKKDSKENLVRIYKNEAEGTKKIITAYNVLGERNSLSLLDVDLVTGRTHQIRAHFSYVGHPLLGDGKYGNIANDKKLGYKHQALCSYYIRFDSDITGTLSSLAGVEVSLDKKNIWFFSEFFG